MSESSSAAAITPPEGWSNKDVYLFKDYYWVDKPDSLRDVLEERHNLSDIKPVWAREPKFGTVLFVFEAKNKNKKTLYYLWNGYEDTVLQFVQETLQNIKNEIVKQGKEGYLKGVKFRPVEELVASIGDVRIGKTRDACLPTYQMTSSAPIESTVAITSPEGWTDKEARLHKDYYWADKPDTVRNVLEKTYGLSNATPIWTCDPDEGEDLFIFQANDPNNQLRYYLWNGLEDIVAQFVQEDLQNIKNEIVSGQGSLRNVQFKDVEERQGTVQ